MQVDDIKKIFHPFRVGGLDLQNRIVMAPMTRSFSPRGIPGTQVAEYYKARSSVGLIVTEGVAVDHPAAHGYEDVPMLAGEEALLGWKRVVEEVHSAGAKIFPQLWHVGNVRRLGVGPNPDIPGYGPMGKSKGGKVLIKAMTKEDIKEVIGAFVRGAAAAKRLGFDGVEIHGAHGYLIDQFLYEGSNKRIDEYGGHLENRARLARELVQAVRKEVGPEYPICFRFSQWKMFDYEAMIAKTPEELGKLLNILVDAGVDIFHCSTRRFWEPAFEGSNLTLSGWTKKLTGKPTIAVGSVGLDQDFMTTFQEGSGESDATSLEKLLAPLNREEFDLIAIGRALIANPDWVDKVSSGDITSLKAYSKTMLESLVP